MVHRVEGSKRSLGNPRVAHQAGVWQIAFDKVLIRNMHAPKVSVIIALYNGEKFIRSAVESVLEQTYSNVELIVIDDGSTDQSRDRLCDLSESLTYVYQENCGVAVARNHGFLHSKGEFIAFLDQDDRWYPQKLETQLAIFNRRTDIGIVYSDVDAIDEGGQIIHERCLAQLPRGGFLSVFPEFPHPHPLPSTVLMRRAVFVQAGMFDPAFKRNCHEDTELWFRVARNHLGQFHFHPEPLVQRRQHALQGGKDLGSRDDNWITCLAKLVALYGEDSKRVRKLKRMLSSAYRRQGMALLATGAGEKGRAYLRQSIKYDPWNLKNWGSYARMLVR